MSILTTTGKVYFFPGGLNTLDDFGDTSWFKSFSEKENGTDWWAESGIFHYDFQPEIPVFIKRYILPVYIGQNGVIVMNILKLSAENALILRYLKNRRYCN